MNKIAQLFSNNTMLNDSIKFIVKKKFLRTETLPVIKQPAKYRIFIANDFPIWFCSQTLHISKTNF